MSKVSSATGVKIGTQSITYTEGYREVLILQAGCHTVQLLNIVCYFCFVDRTAIALGSFLLSPNIQQIHSISFELVINQGSLHLGFLGFQLSLNRKIKAELNNVWILFPFSAQIMFAFLV